MIREIAVQLKAAVAAKGCPIPVIDDHEGTTTNTFARSRIVVSDDDERGDAFRSPRGARSNPPALFDANEAAKIMIYVQSAKAGALPWEHRRLGRKARDLVVCELDKIIRTRGNLWAITGGRFLTPEDLAESERPRGAVYQLLFTIERAVQDHASWSTAAAAEFALDGDNFESTTLVVGDTTTPDAAAATGCGG